MDSCSRDTGAVSEDWFIAKATDCFTRGDIRGGVTICGAGTKTFQSVVCARMAASALISTGDSAIIGTPGTDSSHIASILMTLDEKIDSELIKSFVKFIGDTDK